jgi:DNA polymerase-3 subunit delta
MKSADVRKAIREGQVAPLYLLEGDDPQSRHDVAIEFVALVDEGLHAFNVETFHGSDAASSSSRDAMMSAILAAARTLPMLSPRRVVLVHEAERLLSPKRSKDDADQQGESLVGGKRKRPPTPAEDLEAFFQQPEPSATVVFDAGELDGNRRLVKLLRKHGTVVDCGSLESEQEAKAWVRKRLEKDELAIDPPALDLLVGATGLNLARLRAEVEKLVLYTAGESTVTSRHVQDLVVPQNDPGEDFALGKAIWASNTPEALREVAAQIEAGAQPPMVLGQLRAAAGRLRPDRKAKAGLEAVFEADLRIKSSAGDPRFVLEHLVISLCAR